MAILRPAATLSKLFLIATWVMQEISAELAEQAGTHQRFAFELRTISFISLLLRHMTPPYALSRTFKGVHETGAGPNCGR